MESGVMGVRTYKMQLLGSHRKCSSRFLVPSGRSQVPIFPRASSLVSVEKWR